MLDAPVPNVYTARWFATFLDTIPPERTDQEVAFLAQQMPLPHFSRVLDLACGPGRHALPLARRGYRVTGWDLDGAAIAAARFAAAAEDLPDARFETRDIRTLAAADGPFDAILCLWSSFGWYDAEGNLDLLRRAHDALRPGGRLLLDLYDAAFFEERTGERLHARGGTAVRERNRLDGDRLRVELEYVDGSVDRFEWQVFTLDSLTALGRKARLEPILACAGFDAQTRPCGDMARMQMVLERSEE